MPPLGPSPLRHALQLATRAGQLGDRLHSVRRILRQRFLRALAAEQALHRACGVS